MNKLTQETLIPLGLAVLVIGAGSGWITKTELAVAQVQQTSIEYKEKFKKICDLFEGITKRLDKIDNEIQKLPRR